MDPTPNQSSSETDTDAPHFVEELLRKAEQAGASDIHLQRIHQSAQISFRLDGVIVPSSSIPDPLAERVFGRIKYLSRLKTYQDALPQDGRIDHKDVGATHDIRVATYPTITGEKIVLRLFQADSGQQLHELGLPDPTRLDLEHLLRSPQGLLLLTGPAGSGKTTTIYACLRYLQNLGGRHIITIEDPVEQIIPGLMQTEVNEALDLSFPKAARHLLRQDPQVLVVGEIRDDETANVVVRAALTGHLVITTLHAGSCHGVLERLQLMCSDPHAALASISMILNQRLLRRVCKECSGKGCNACLLTGYRGRIPITESIIFNDSIRSQIRTQGINGIHPPVTLQQRASQLVQSGITLPQEFDRWFASPPVTPS